jgi:hypothetical protein
VLIESPEPGEAHAGLCSRSEAMCGAWLAQQIDRQTFALLLCSVASKTHCLALRSH